MNNKSIRNRLQNVTSPLSKSEERIAQYVLKNIAEVVQSPISVLAKNIGTSPSTITRFCKKLNYKNYIEFQTLLKSEKMLPPKQLSSVQLIRKSYNEILDSSNEIIKEKQIKTLTTAIETADKIVIIGIGSSGLSAIEFAVRLNNMGLSAVSITDSYTMLAQTSLLKDNDLLIVLSNSGKTKEIIQSIKIANSKNINVFGLTKENNTPLTDSVSSVIFTGYTESVNNNTFFNDQLSVLFFIDVLTYELLKNDTFKSNYHFVTKTLIEKNMSDN